MPDVKPDSAATTALLERIAERDPLALDGLLARQRPELREFVELHMDPRLRARIDPSDVVQETHLELARRIDDFLSRRPMPFHLWQRKKAYERMLNLRRDHVRRQRRSVMREAHLPDRSSALLAQPLLRSSASPSRDLAAKEAQARVRRAVGRLSRADRAILLMRHAEDMSFGEIACLLSIEPAAARKRFGRALIRLQKLLSEEGILDS